MSDEPDDILTIEKVFQDLPVTFHVGGPERIDTVVGWANAWSNDEDGTITMAMNLDAGASKKLKDLVTKFNPYAIGIVAVPRKEQPN